MPVATYAAAPSRIGKYAASKKTGVSRKVAKPGKLPARKANKAVPLGLINSAG